MMQAMEEEMESLKTSKKNLEAQNTSLVKEKTQLRKAVEERENEIERLKGTDLYLNRKPGFFAEQQLKQELE